MKENKEIRIVQPEFLLDDIYYIYSEVLKQFKENLFLFTYLKNELNLLKTNAKYK